MSRSTALSDFPNAPTGWTLAFATNKASELGIVMGPEHWDIIICLQEFFAKNESINRRDLSDALEEYWHHQGGLKALYRLFPNGPIAQGCEIAGLPIPSGSVDKSFGSTS